MAEIVRLPKRYKSRINDIMILIMDEGKEQSWTNLREIVAEGRKHYEESCKGESEEYIAFETDVGVWKYYFEGGYATYPFKDVLDNGEAEKPSPPAGGGRYTSTPSVVEEDMVVQPARPIEGTDARTPLGVFAQRLREEDRIVAAQKARVARTAQMADRPRTSAAPPSVPTGPRAMSHFLPRTMTGNGIGRPSDANHGRRRDRHRKGRGAGFKSSGV